jgi:hypothetical protein
MSQRTHCLRPLRFAIWAFREGALVEELPEAGTELRIAVFPLPVEHRVRLQRVERVLPASLSKPV